MFCYTAAPPFDVLNDVSRISCLLVSAVLLSIQYFLCYYCPSLSPSERQTQKTLDCIYFYFSFFVLKVIHTLFRNIYFYEVDIYLVLIMHLQVLWPLHLLTNTNITLGGSVQHMHVAPARVSCTFVFTSEGINSLTGW